MCMRGRWSREEIRQVALAMAEAFHPRLGSDSPASLLPQWLAFSVVDLAHRWIPASDPLEFGRTYRAAGCWLLLVECCSPSVCDDGRSATRIQLQSTHGDALFVFERPHGFDFREAVLCAWDHKSPRFGMLAEPRALARSPIASEQGQLMTQPQVADLRDRDFSEAAPGSRWPASARWQRQVGVLVEVLVGRVVVRFAGRNAVFEGEGTGGGVTIDLPLKRRPEGARVQPFAVLPRR
eukprot:m51a1_g516 hypothetical protein (237) ;mRNA; f:324698-325408